jgi:hypothetical protein
MQHTFNNQYGVVLQLIEGIRQHPLVVARYFIIAAKIVMSLRHYRLGKVWLLKKNK